MSQRHVVSFTKPACPERMYLTKHCVSLSWSGRSIRDLESQKSGTVLGDGRDLGRGSLWPKVFSTKRTKLAEEGL
jgi:hypothetical protein